LQFNEKNILMQAGKISHQMAQELSEKELAKYEEQLRKVVPSVNTAKTSFQLSSTLS